MMSSPEKLYEKWKLGVPAEVKFSEVEKIAKHFFGAKNCRSAAHGSHVLIIEGPVVEMAYMAGTQNTKGTDLAWLTNDNYSIPKTKSKVKRVYVKQLLKLIEFKLNIYDKIQNIKK
jgi:hypothetical protein